MIYIKEINRKLKAYKILKKIQGNVRRMGKRFSFFVRNLNCYYYTLSILLDYTNVIINVICRVILF